MESLWVYEEFGEFLVIKPKTNPPRQKPNHARDVTFTTPLTKTHKAV